MSEFAESIRRSRVAAMSDEQLRAVVLAVEGLRPTHRHRGMSWGSGDVEYVAWDDLRAALRPTATEGDQP